MTDALGLLALLIGLELVLGVDNILVISIFVSRIEESRRNFARILGLSLALVARLLMLLLVLALTGLTTPVLFDFSVRDLLLLAGGLFLLYKAAKEIHHTVELQDAHPRVGKAVSFAGVITQIVLLDIVFSIDSVITAVGLTHEVWIIVTSVLVSFVGVLLFAKPIGDFIMRTPTIKILALSFLITIGVTIFIEGLHQHVPKAYIYLPMGFALGVELLQLRYDANRSRLKKGAS
jgi:predicted tellurium resistance membrane protein TerC